MSKEKQYHDEWQEDDLYEDEDGQIRYLIFLAADRYFAVPALSVREMLPVQKVTALPEAPDWVRGVINVRNETFTLVDFRKRIGMDGSLEERNQLINELDQRELEHMQWIDMLEDSVNENLEFVGETDPHKCKFGIWYDSYEAPSVAVQLELKKFDDPHRAIHATAGEILNLKEAGKVDEAKNLIASRRNGEMARMISLFESLKRNIRDGDNEVIILIDDENLKFSMIVDRVESVETLSSEENTALKNFQQEDGKFAHHTGIAKRGDSGSIVYVVDPAWIIEGGEELVLDQSE